MDYHQILRLSDQELLYQATRHDNFRGDDEIHDAKVLRTADALDREVLDRFGPNANDNLADFFTASHASPDDRIWWTQERHEVLIEIARGTHQHKAQGQHGSCICGVLAEFIPGTRLAFPDSLST